MLKNIKFHGIFYKERTETVLLMNLNNSIFIWKTHPTLLIITYYRNHQIILSGSTKKGESKLSIILVIQRIKPIHVVL